MTVVKCHYCNRQIEGNILWIRPFAGGEPVDGNVIQTYSAVSSEEKPGSVPCCSECLDKLKQQGRQMRSGSGLL